MSSQNSEILRRLALESDLYPHGISEEFWRVERGAPKVVCLVREAEAADPTAMELLRSIVEKGVGVPWGECRVSLRAPHPMGQLIIAFGVDQDLDCPVIETDSLAELAGSREKKRVLWERLKALSA